MIKLGKVKTLNFSDRALIQATEKSGKRLIDAYCKSVVANPMDTGDLDMEWEIARLQEKD